MKEEERVNRSKSELEILESEAKVARRRAEDERDVYQQMKRDLPISKVKWQFMEERSICSES